MEIIPKAAGIVICCALKSPQTVADRGSMEAIIDALPASVVSSPNVYNKNGRNAVTKPVRKTETIKYPMLFIDGICFIIPGKSQTIAAPKQANIKE